LFLLDQFIDLTLVLGEALERTREFVFVHRVGSRSTPATAECLEQLRRHFVDRDSAARDLARVADFAIRTLRSFAGFPTRTGCNLAGVTRFAISTLRSFASVAFAIRAAERITLHRCSRLLLPLGPLLGIAGVQCLVGRTILLRCRFPLAVAGALLLAGRVLLLRRR
jgi:hypothetical protein